MQRGARRDVQRCRGSAERERKRFHARIETFDLELAIHDGRRLPDQLIEPLVGPCSSTSAPCAAPAG